MSTPPQAERTGRLPAVGKDLFASVVVFLVALPLCMGIAVASGAAVAAGLITGIVGGLLVAPIAGSPLQVSGPAAGLTVVVYDVIQNHGLSALGITVLMAGTMQFVAGLLRLGQWFRAVSPAVIYGMLAGIGVLILSSQFHVMVDDNPRKGGWANLITIPEAVRKGLPMPVIHPREVRAMRRSWLQSFGALHERQIEILANVADVASVGGTEEEHMFQSQALLPLAAEQASLQEQFEGLSAQVQKAGVDGKSAALQEALTGARAALEAAYEDLLEHRFETIDASQQDAANALSNVLARLKNHDWAAKLGLLTIFIIVAWQILPKKVQLVPGPLIAVVVVTGLATYMQLPVLYVEIPAQITEGIHWPSWATLNDVSLYTLAKSAVVLAVVASAETLLCATAVDQMHRGVRTRYDRELCAQGLGNMVCGFLGALPMTGVIVRSAANVHAGATTRLSATLHGLWLLIFVLVLGSWLRLIPTSVLAGVLVYTGYKLVNPKAVKGLLKYGKSEVAIYLATLTAIVVEDLLTGVVLGIVLSALKLLFVFSRFTADLVVSDGGKHATMQLRGAATFIRLPLLAARLEEVPPQAHLHVDLQKLRYIDHACLNLLMNWAPQHETTGGRLSIDWGSLHATFGKPNR